ASLGGATANGRRQPPGGTQNPAADAAGSPCSHPPSPWKGYGNLRTVTRNGPLWYNRACPQEGGAMPTVTFDAAHSAMLRGQFHSVIVRDENGQILGRIVPQLTVDRGTAEEPGTSSAQ